MRYPRAVVILVSNCCAERLPMFLSSMKTGFEDPPGHCWPFASGAKAAVLPSGQQPYRVPAQPPIGRLVVPGHPS